MQSNNNHPLACANLVAGVIITVIGGLVLAFIIQDARFSPQRRQDSSDTITPQTTQLEPSSRSFTTFGPDNGKLDYDPTNIKIEYRYAYIHVQDFVVESVFFNPYDSSEGEWSYGFVFRDEGQKLYAFYVRWNKTWHFDLINVVTDGRDEYNEKASGYTEIINDSANGSNHIKLLVLQNTAYVFINQTFITTLNVDEILTSGDIAIAAGFSNDGIQGKSTAYSNFGISKLDATFGPDNGKLDHDPTNGLVEDRYAHVHVQDFVAESVFFNPYDSSEGKWSYGFLFRSVAGQNYLFYILWDKTWHIGLHTKVADNWELTNRANGYAEIINDSANGSNHIRLLVLQNTAYVFINQTFITTLDIARSLKRGDIAVAIGFTNGDEIQGKSTSYEGFHVFSFTE